MIKYLKGNVLDAKTDVIAHQVNCKGQMGGGVALQIKNQYPEVFDLYYSLCKESGYKKLLLGTMQLCKTKKKLIANLFGQYDCGGSELLTDYDALKTSMKNLSKNMEELGLKSVAFPDMIGCGLAGGERAVVLEMIEEVFADFNVEIWAYK